MICFQELFHLDQPHGPGAVLFSWQHGSGGYLATTGSDCNVCIYNRHGKLEQKIRLSGYVLYIKLKHLGIHLHVKD